ncbi:MAG: enoyl-CoA hydratase/isomerase family protein [Deltaproteobacteria bacterium]|nr:enoyl-CoA hydratase/isomerase family protein [Deltaproteobacteria bacterium]
MSYANIIYEVEGFVATIAFNRPKALNAMNSDTMKELHDAIGRVRNDESVKAAIITGAGEKAFVAGADIVQMQAMAPVDALSFMEFAHETLRNLETLSKPVIAAVNGYALGGGCEIAMACDVRFAAEKARFGQPEVLLGIIPGWGGTQRLARLVGLGRAKELIYGCEQIDARRALEIGLVNRIYPGDQLMAETRKFAAQLAERPPFAVKMAKQAMTFGYDLSLESANRLEVECCAQCFSTADQKEGMKAFLEKRKAIFTGR